MAKMFFFDLETTGTEYWRHSIHQISGVIEIDGQVVEKFDWDVQPNPKSVLVGVEEALAIGGKTLDQVMAHRPMMEVWRDLNKLLEKYVDKYQKKHLKEKLWLVGYNSQGFDVPFFRAWFKQCGDNYFGSWFWPHSIDVMILALHQLMFDRREMEDFKLATVAKKFGIEVDEARLHDALYDIWLTRELFKRVNTMKPVKPVQPTLFDMAPGNE